MNPEIEGYTMSSPRIEEAIPPSGFRSSSARPLGNIPPMSASAAGAMSAIRYDSSSFESYFPRYALSILNGA